MTYGQYAKASLDPRVKYMVERVGPDTNSVVKGETYRIEFRNRKWYIMEDLNTALYWANEGTFLNKKFWCLSLNAETKPKEKCMSFDKVKEEALEVNLGWLINGHDAKTFSDKSLISMIQAEKAKKETLAEQVGAGSIYYKAKVAKMDLNLQYLSNLLDERA